MKIVIDIEQELYEEILSRKYSKTRLEKAVANGTPLPKHHGRLIDADSTLAKAWTNFGKHEDEKAKWIPVSERLPEIHQDVLLSLRSLDVRVGYRAFTEPYFYCYCYGEDSCYTDPQNVLAWMPLPEPYKAESEDKK